MKSRMHHENYVLSMLPRTYNTIFKLQFAAQNTLVAALKHIHKSLDFKRFLSHWPLSTCWLDKYSNSILYINESHIHC